MEVRDKEEGDITLSLANPSISGGEGVKVRMMMSGKHARLSGSRANNKQPYDVKKLQSSKTEPRYQTPLTTTPPWPPLPCLVCTTLASSRFDSLTHQSNPFNRSTEPEESRPGPDLTKNGGRGRCRTTAIDLQSFVRVSGPRECAIKRSNN